MLKTVRLFKISPLLVAAVLFLAPSSSSLAAESQAATIPIVCASAPTSFTADLATKEIRRYLYLRTGSLLPISGELSRTDEAIILAGKGEQVLGLLVDAGAANSAEIQALGAQEYLLKTLSGDGRRLHFIVGGDAIGMLYGAYRFIEHFGVRFYIHGDTIPDGRIPLEVPDLNEHGAPRFELRGLVPFHDFPEGPDWWTPQDWQSVMAQLAKMRMNFIGFHTYLHRPCGPEPTVWVGLPRDVNADGTVEVSDATSWHNTQRYAEAGFYRPKKTGDFSFGGSQIFEHDDFGPAINEGEFPLPSAPERANALTNRAGAMLRESFELAHALGIKTSVGTEVPLNISNVVRQRLLELGMDPNDPATRQELYEGTFLRIKRAYPVDYYWLWAREGQTDATEFIADVRSALSAAEAMDLPFDNALCGWGWIAERFTTLDTVLPKDVPFSCANTMIGFDRVPQAFRKLPGRKKWAIPWIEDDVGITVPQLWVGRMRKDAADAAAFGVDGLMGLHWRTRITGPTVSALAREAWTQGKWVERSGDAGSPEESVVAYGGKTAAYPAKSIARTDDDPLYQTVRYDLDGYEFNVPNGRYTVVLKFAEIAYYEAGKRAFGVEIEGKRVIDGLDVAARVGASAALDLTFENIEVEDGALNIDFLKQIELPCVAAITVEGSGVSRKVNCGGQPFGDYMEDPKPTERRPEQPDEADEPDEPILAFGGKTARYIKKPIANTDDDYLYQTVRFNLDGYRFEVPNGKYTVHLKFAEVAYNQPGKRVFGVKLQGRRVIDSLDIYAEVGSTAALDYTFRDVYVVNGYLDLDFLRQVELPCISAISVEGAGASLKVNCGGRAYGDYIADTQPVEGKRHMATDEFYLDWATTQFGPEAAGNIARIFSSIDGKLPRPCRWTKGPGVIDVVSTPWEQTAPEYEFVDRLAALRPGIEGAGNLERFDWWLNNFRAMKAMALVGHTRGELDRAMEAMGNERDPTVRRWLAESRGLELRTRLVQQLGEMYGYMLATLNNSSEMGMIANIEQQSMLRMKILTEHDYQLAEYLGAPLPEETRPWKDYRGDTRIVVMSGRSGITAGDGLTLKVIIMTREKPEETTLFWRPLGGGRFSEVPLKHVSRSVYSVTLPEAATRSDFEYYIRASENDDSTVVYPATAPDLNQTVVVMKPHLDEGGG